MQTITVPLREVDRTVLDGQEEGVFRVHIRRGSDRVLGATLVGEHAGEMIGEIALAITAGGGLSKVGTTIHPYPRRARCSARRRMPGGGPSSRLGRGGSHGRFSA